MTEKAWARDFDILLGRMEGRVAMNYGTRLLAGNDHPVIVFPKRNWWLPDEDERTWRQDVQAMIEAMPDTLALHILKDSAIIAARSPEEPWLTRVPPREQDVVQALANWPGSLETGDIVRGKTKSAFGSFIRFYQKPYKMYFGDQRFLLNRMRSNLKAIGAMRGADKPIPDFDKMMRSNNVTGAELFRRRRQVMAMAWSYYALASLSLGFMIYGASLVYFLLGLPTVTYFTLRALRNSYTCWQVDRRAFGGWRDFIHAPDKWIPLPGRSGE